MKVHHRRGLWASFLGGLTALAGAGVAVAADASSASAPNAAETEVTITGSRLRETGMQMPTPVTVMTSQQLDLVAPGNIVEAFKELPQFLGNIDATQNNGIGTDAGQSIVNMRNLGGNRTLVLLDGRRLVPSTYNGTVDINVLPPSLLKRTEIVTGGASAAYGTDAVAGVVNFLLDTDYTGLKGRVQGGITGRGDGANKQGELTFGTAIGEKAHLLASVDYFDSNPINGVRPWMQSWGVVLNPAWATNKSQPEYFVEPHVGSSIYTPGGLIISPGTPGSAARGGGLVRPCAAWASIGQSTEKRARSGRSCRRDRACHYPGWRGTAHRGP